MKHKFPIGTVYTTRGKHQRICTVIDQLTTYNAAGKIVSIRYVSEHEFMGQKVYDYDVVETTVAIGVHLLAERA